MTPTDEDIREMAKARVALRQHALAYVAVNVFLVVVWWATGRDGFYWPLWVHLGWGIGLAWNAWCVLGGGQDAVAREEEKLRRQHGRA